MNKTHKTMESINISDTFSGELEIDSIIYRGKFEEYRDKYLEKQNEVDLIFVYIFLQIYIEVFLHKNMRKIIEFEFSSNDKKKFEEWKQYECKKIKEKLTIFIKMFFIDNENNVMEIKKQIEDIFIKITDIRNKLLHGHKISEEFDDSGKIKLSKSRSILTQNEFSNILREANKLCDNWNRLLDMVILKCKSLRVIDDFKFNVL